MPIQATIVTSVNVTAPMDINGNMTIVNSNTVVTIVYNGNNTINVTGMALSHTHDT